MSDIEELRKRNHAARDEAEGSRRAADVTFMLTPDETNADAWFDAAYKADRRDHELFAKMIRAKFSPQEILDAGRREFERKGNQDRIAHLGHILHGYPRSVLTETIFELSDPPKPKPEGPPNRIISEDGTVREKEPDCACDPGEPRPNGFIPHSIFCPVTDYRAEKDRERVQGSNWPKRPKEDELRCAHDGATCHHECVNNQHGCTRSTGGMWFSDPEPQPLAFREPTADLRKQLEDSRKQAGRSWRIGDELLDVLKAVWVAWGDYHSSDDTVNIVEKTLNKYGRETTLTDGKKT